MSFPEITLPRMVKVKQHITSPQLDDLVTAIHHEMQRSRVKQHMSPGDEIAITAGSRGVAHYPQILAAIVDFVKQAGGHPFIIPSMGSHGGATPEGQTEVLHSLGITPETVGAPIRASMEVEQIGRLKNGNPVFVDRIAHHADGIIVVGRVKPHTDFKGTIESGLMKMMVIGLGKQKGAEMIHRHRSEGYHKILPEAARLILKQAKVLLGVAIVENAHHEIAVVKALPPNEIEREEKKLLEQAKTLIARLPFSEIDVLIVEEVGKDISGTGMDTNVVGRFWLPGETAPLAPTIKRIVVLDLTEHSHGNAVGLGLADITTQRVVSQIDYQATFTNVLTAGHTETGRTPIFLPNDRAAIRMALQTSVPMHSTTARVIRIKNTLQLGTLWISESLKKEMDQHRDQYTHLHIQGEPQELQFDILGNLAR
jgi:hypothetical protein